MRTPCLCLDLHVNSSTGPETFWKQHQGLTSSVRVVWEPLPAPTAAQGSTHKKSCGSVDGKHVSEINYQLWGTHIRTWEREKKKKKRERKGREKTKLQNYWLHTCVETKLNQSLQALILLKQKLIIHCSKQTFPSGLSSAVQIQLGAHILDISSQDRKYYFSSIWMD